jgi:hypothetical protein
MTVSVIISQDHEDLLSAIENDIEILMQSMFLFQSKNYMKVCF